MKKIFKNETEESKIIYDLFYLTPDETYIKRINTIADRMPPMQLPEHNN